MSKTNKEYQNNKILVVCDVQPDVVQKIPNREQFLDLIRLTIQATRQSSASASALTTTTIIYTMIQFSQDYKEIPLTHPRLSVLRRLATTKKWFTSSDLCFAPMPNDIDKEYVLKRTTFLPQANDATLLQVLQNAMHNRVPDSLQQQPNVTIVGYGPTVQAMCHLLGDALAVPNVQVLRECVRDENTERCQAWLDHGLLFGETVTSLVDYFEACNVLHERILLAETEEENLVKDNGVNDTSTATTTNNNVKYVSDCGRGGHLSLFLPYLLRDYGYKTWPIQPWYQDMSAGLHSSTKQYYCPLGKRMVDLCDEPQFGTGTHFFLAGRQHLDEKDLLYELVPELMPLTFASLDQARAYAAKQQPQEEQPLVWFLKKVNQNGGRAVTVTNDLPSQALAKDDQLQVHVPRPLLFHDKTICDEGPIKCHVKTYQFIACCPLSASDETLSGNNANQSSSYCWKLYMHDLFYLATATKPWSPKDTSDEAQITTMRTHRLYANHPWRIQWNLTEKCQSNMKVILQRAVQQGKLQTTHVTTTTTTNKQTDSTTKENGPKNDTFQHGRRRLHHPDAALQFEINSADWMLAQDGRMYLIECNGIPVLYDGGNQEQALLTRGLKLYDRLYKENPDTAVVNDHELLKDALGLAMTGKLASTSLWQHLATYPSVV